MEAVQWNEDRSVLRIATAGSRRKTLVTDLILAAFVGFFLISFASSSLDGVLAVLVGVLIAAVTRLALFALRRQFSFPYMEFGEAGIQVHKRYSTTRLR